jgi:MerR family transcriptional regulator, light-induced transcriptional regulator
MASVFGISTLMSRLDSWRGGRKDAPPVLEFAEQDASVSHLSLVHSKDSPVDLSLLLENLVIPKLIAGEQNRQPLVAQKKASPHIPIDDAMIDQFAKMSVEGDTRSLIEFVDDRLNAGSTTESIFVDLLAPAARRLGQYWEDDSGDFVDVTMGLWRIQEILRELTVRVPPDFRGGFGQRRALFSTMPGEQHSFGTLMVGECFQRAGWDAEILIEPTNADIFEKVAGTHFDMAGLTVSCDCPTAAIRSLVSSIKSVSENPHIRVFLGGRVINEQPELVEACGADATAIDAPSAVALADRLVPVRAECFERLI